MKVTWKVSLLTRFGLSIRCNLVQRRPRVCPQIMWLEQVSRSCQELLRMWRRGDFHGELFGRTLHDGVTGRVIQCTPLAHAPTVWLMPRGFTLSSTLHFTIPIGSSEQVSACHLSIPSSSSQDALACSSHEVRGPLRATSTQYISYRYNLVSGVDFCWLTYCLLL